MSDLNDDTLAVAFVKDALERAERGESRLIEEVLTLPGMSGRKMRHAFNNLNSLPGTNYLEVGCYKGSTLISSLFHNQQMSAIGIDNFSQFELDDSQAALENNLARLISKKSGTYRLLYEDCFKVDPLSLNCKPNVFFYDGEHSQTAQRDGVLHFAPIFEYPLILLVDDYEWDGVRAGTQEALATLGCRILYDTWQRGAIVDGQHDGANWWNGLYVAVLEQA